MNNEEIVLIQKYVYGVTEHEHDVRKGSISQSNNYQCYKCDREFWVKPSDTNTCPIPDPLPGSEADQTEMVRKWMEKHWDETGSSDAFGHELEVMWGEYTDDKGEIAYSDWLIFECTPADKLRAAIETFKELERKEK